MVDRRLVGFIAIILVTTTVVSLLIFQVSEEEYVQILASRTPANIGGGRPASPSFSLDLMASRDLPDLRVKFHFLQNLSGITLEKLWKETSGRQPDDLISNVPRLLQMREQLDDLTQSLGSGSTYTIYEVDRGPLGKLQVLDFTDIMAAMAGEERLKTVYTVYAFDFGEGGRVSVYGGYRDFFFRRDTVITEVRYTTPSKTVCFRSEDFPAGIGDCGTIAEAPTGLVHIQDLAEGDRIHLEVTLNTQNMFGHTGIYELITTETGHGHGPTLAEWIGAKGT